MEDYKRKKTILFISHYADLLGANRSLLGLLEYVQRSNLYTPIVLLPREGEICQALEELGVKYLRLRFYSSVYEKKNFLDVIKSLFRGLLNVFILIKLYFLFKKDNIDLIHTNSSTINIGAYLSLMLKIPHIWHFREFAKLHYHLCFNCGYKLQIYIWRKYSTQIVTISNALKDYCLNLGCRKIITIYNGIALRNKMLKIAKEDDFFHIAMVGVLHPGKHQDVVIRALAKIVNEYECKNLHLHVYGQYIDDTYRIVIEDLVKNNGLEKYISFYGYQTNVRQKTENCHIGILASEYEAFGRVTIEYMDNKMIPIVSNSGANIEIIDNGVNGLIFETNSVDSLVSCIVKVMKEYKSLGWMLDNIQKSVSKYSVKANAEQVVLLYNNILNVNN